MLQGAKSSRNLYYFICFFSFGSSNLKIKFCISSGHLLFAQKNVQLFPHSYVFNNENTYISSVLENLGKVLRNINLIVRKKKKEKIKTDSLGKLFLKTKTTQFTYWLLNNIQIAGKPAQSGVFLSIFAVHAFSHLHTSPSRIIRHTHRYRHN